MKWLMSFFDEFYFLVSEMAPYLLLGFLFAGLLKVFFPQEKISKFLGKKKMSSVTNAALLGVPMPLCSCGVIPTGVSFYNNGATKGATTSFLISTPQTGVDSILATYSLLGLPLAIIRPLVAFLTGILGGAASHLIEKNQWHRNGDPEHAIGESQDKVKGWKRLEVMVRYGFGELVEDIVKWLLIGLGAAALLSILIPDSFFTQYIGNPYLEMILILAASIPLYVCATGSIPLAAVLLMKGISPGAALVFLMAGPATNVATISVIGKTMGKRALFVYLFSIIGGALLFGTLVNELLPKQWFLGHAVMAHEHGGLPEWMKMGSAILLGGIMLLAIWNKWIKYYFKHKTQIVTDMSNQMKILTVEGMTCSHCKATVENNLKLLEGIESAEANPQLNEVRITGEQIDLDAISRKINDLGYSYRGEK